MSNDLMSVDASFVFYVSFFHTPPVAGDLYEGELCCEKYICIAELLSFTRLVLIQQRLKALDTQRHVTNSSAGSVVQLLCGAASSVPGQDALLE